MTQRTRTTIAVSVGVIALGVIGFQLYHTLSSAQANADNRRTGPAEPIDARKTVDRIGMDAIIETVRTEAYDGWIDAGISGERAAALAADLPDILHGVGGHDFNAYHEFAAARGGQLSDRAESIVRRADQQAQTPLPGETLEERLAHLWQDHTLRDSAWHRIDLERVRSGRGTAMPGSGIRGVNSLYDFPDGQEVYMRAFNGETDAAWVEVPVEFDSGRTVTLRMLFVYDDQREQWIPRSLMHRGPERHGGRLLF